MKIALLPVIDICVITQNVSFDSRWLLNYFPNGNVFQHTPQNMENYSLAELYNDKIIGAGGYKSMKNGRRWHSDLYDKGGVSLALANRIVLAQNDERPLLLFEDDFEIRNMSKFANILKSLIRKDHDMAVFGAALQGSRDLRVVPKLPGWYHLSSDAAFFFTHAVFYSARGRKIVSKWLLQERLDMQIDSLYSLWSETRRLDIVVELDDWTVVQKSHASSIQTDRCYICKAHEYKRSTFERMWNFFLTITS